MIRYGIAQFTGLWVSASGARLEIKKVDDAQALVDFFDVTGNPVRPVHERRSFGSDGRTLRRLQWNF